ncbi:MAG: hypothetical protein ACE5LU_00005, partial [Anaerolineae bacterium]
MKPTYKFLVLALLIATMLLAVSACTQAPAGEVQVKEVEVTRIVEVDKAASEEAIPEGATVIDFWHAFGGGRKFLIERMVADYNYTHPGTFVRVEHKGSYRDT